MSYPATDPINAVYNADGVAVPAGWVAVYSYAQDDVRDGIPVPYCKIESVRLRIPQGQGFKTHALALGELNDQNPALLAQFFYQFMRELELIWYLRFGMIGAGGYYPHVQPDGTPLCQQWTVEVVDVGAASVTLSRTPAGTDASDPARMLLDETSGTYTAIQPGDLLRSGRNEALALGYGTVGISSVVVRLNKPLVGCTAGGTLEVWRQVPSAWFPMQAWRTRWCEVRRTGWSNALRLNLGKADGSGGRIAWPDVEDPVTEELKGFAGHLKVWGLKQDGTCEIVTSQALSGFPGHGDEPALSIYVDEDGFYRSEITRALVPGYVKLFARYVVEAVSQIAPGYEQFKGCQMACQYVTRDWSNSIGSGSVPGTYVNSGKHWFCSKRKAVPSWILAEFDEWCFQSECPHFTRRVAYRPSLSDLLRLVMGRNLYLKEIGADTFSVSKSSGPSLFELAGMASYTGQDTNQLSQLIWYSGNGPTQSNTTAPFGLLEAIPSGELAEDEESGCKRLTYGSIKGQGAGLLAALGPYAKPDPAGGLSCTAQGLYDDGSDFYWEEAFQPLRRTFSVPLTEPGFALPSAEGSEAQVQRVIPAKRRVTRLTTGTDAERDGWKATWNETGGLRLTFKPLRERTYEQKTIGDKAATIYSATLVGDGAVLMLEFEPDEVTCEDTSGSYTWRSGGGTVCAPMEKRVYSNKAASQNAFGDPRAKLSRGDTIKIGLLIEEYAQTALTCIWAQSHMGQLYTGDGASTVPSGASVPDVYRDDLWRLRRDVAYFDFPSGGPAGHLKNYLGGDMSLLANKKITITNESVFPPLRSISWNGGISVHETGYEVSLEHFTQGTPNRLETIGPDVLEFDPANGVVDVPESVVASWDRAAQHHFALLHAASGGGCYMFARHPVFAAEMVTHLRQALRCLGWYEPEGAILADTRSLSMYSPYGGMVSPGVFYASVCTNGQWRPLLFGGAANKTWPSSISSGLMTPYGGWKSGAIAPIGAFVPMEMDVSPNILEEHNAAWDELYVIEGGSAYQDGCCIMSGDYNGEVANTQAFALVAQAIEMTPEGLGRFRAEYIAEALVDVKVSDCVARHVETTMTWDINSGTQSETTITETNCPLVIRAYRASRVLIQTGPEAYEWGWRLTHGGSSSSFLAPTNGKWRTVDVTGVVRGLCALDYEESDKVFLVVQAGGSDLTEMSFSGFASSCFSLSKQFGDYDPNTNPEGYVEKLPYWDGEKWVDGDGHVGNVVGAHLTKDHLSYTGVGFRRLKVRLDHAGIENDDYLPHLALLPDGVGHAPDLA